MDDSELANAILEHYQSQLEDGKTLTEQEVASALPLVLFLIKIFRVQPPLPEHIDPSKNIFTIFTFVIEHLTDGRATINAKTLISKGRGLDDINEDIALLKHYLNELSDDSNFATEKTIN